MEEEEWKDGKMDGWSWEDLFDPRVDWWGGVKGSVKIGECLFCILSLSP